MKIQEVLENYNSLKASITITEGEIQELKNEVLDCRSANLDGMPKAQGYTTSSIETYIAEKEEKINNKQRKGVVKNGAATKSAAPNGGTQGAAGNEK